VSLGTRSSAGLVHQYVIVRFCSLVCDFRLIVTEGLWRGSEGDKVSKSRRYAFQLSRGLAYPIHSSEGGSPGGFTHNGLLLRWSKSSAVYRTAITAVHSLQEPGLAGRVKRYPRARSIDGGDSERKGRGAIAET
jgi:hypothetical protein